MVSYAQVDCNFNIRVLVDIFDSHQGVGDLSQKEEGLGQGLSKRRGSALLGEQLSCCHLNALKGGDVVGNLDRGSRGVRLKRASGLAGQVVTDVAKKACFSAVEELAFLAVCATRRLSHGWIIYSKREATEVEETLFGTVSHGR